MPHGRKITRGGLHSTWQERNRTPSPVTAYWRNRWGNSDCPLSCEEDIANIETTLDGIDQANQYIEDGDGDENEHGYTDNGEDCDWNFPCAWCRCRGLQTPCTTSIRWAIMETEFNSNPIGNVGCNGFTASIVTTHTEADYVDATADGDDNDDTCNNIADNTGNNDDTCNVDADNTGNNDEADNDIADDTGNIDLQDLA